MAQAVVIISGGIDLSVGSMMGLVNVLSAKYMLENAATLQAVSFREAIVISIVLILGGALAGALTGLIITVTKVADIIVTLAMLFIWGGAALAVMQIPGGGAPLEFTKLAIGYTLTPWLPSGLVILAVVVLLSGCRSGGASPVSRSTRSARAGTPPSSPASPSRGRGSAPTRSGRLAAMGGLALTATSGIGDALSGQYYTLNSVAAVVLGGVALVGGVGGLIGPIAAAFVLTLVKSIMILKGVDQNWAQVIQGTLIVLVVMIGGLALRQRGKHP